MERLVTILLFVLFIYGNVMNKKLLNIRFLCLAGLIIMMIGCRQQSRKGRVIPVDLKAVCDVGEFERFIAGIRFIPLETQDSVVTGKVGKCVVQGDVISLSECGQQVVYQFTADGKYIRTLNRPGRAADEYTELTDITAGNGKGLILLDGISRKLMFLDGDLNLCHSVKVQSADKILRREDGQVVLYNDTPHSGEAGLVIYDQEGEMLFHAFEGDGSNRNRLKYRRDSHLSLFGDTVVVVRSFDYRVYYLVNDSVYSPYCFDFGAENMPADLLEGDYLSVYKRVLKNQSVQMLDRYMETDQWITFEVNNKAVWWNKKQEKAYLPDNGWEIPYSLLFNRAPLCVADHGKYYMVVTAANLKNGIGPLLSHGQYLEKYDFLRQLVNMELEEEGNDILVEVTMK